jgi:hypothetical protein
MDALRLPSLGALDSRARWPFGFKVGGSFAAAMGIRYGVASSDGVGPFLKRHCTTSTSLRWVFYGLEPGVFWLILLKTGKSRA